MMLKVLPPDEAKKRARENVSRWKRRKLASALRHREGPCAEPVMRGQDHGGSGKTELDTQLLAAIETGGPEGTIIELLRSGADIEAKDGQGFTPLLTAILYDRKRICRMLLEMGASVHTGDNSGKTPLMMAACGGDADLIELLLRKGADIEGKNMGGVTALMHAVANDSLKGVRALVGHGADLDASSNDGLTALMFAARSGLCFIMEYLIKAGADIEARDNMGITALGLALREFKYEAAEVLRRYGGAE